MSRKSRQQRQHHERTRASWLAPLVVGGLTFLAFLPALRAEFVSWDDSTNFVTNLAYRGLDWPHLEWMWTTTHLGHYVPLSWMTLGLDYLLWGMNPAGYHLVNLLLHTANAVLLYFIARRVLQLGGVGEGLSERARVLPPAFAALFYAVHPLRVESVAWITERRDVLSLLFVLATTLLYLRAMTEPARFRRWYGLSLAAFVCALLSKATAVTLPAALLVLNVYPLGRVGRHAGWWSASARRAYAELIPYSVLSAGAALVSIMVLQPEPQLPLAAKLVVSAYGFVFYLWKTIAPVNLSPLYPMSSHVDPSAPIFIATGIAAIGIVIMLWAVRRRWPAITAGVVAFTALLFPLLGFVQNGPQIAADRYTYLAGPALALAVAAAFALPVRIGISGWAAAVLVGVLGVGTWRQCGVWRNSEVLWSRVLQLDGESALAHNNLGAVLAEKGKTDEAIEHYRRAIQILPGYADPHNNFGYELAERGQLDAAIEQFRAALAINPGLVDPEINWGNALYHKKQFDGAMAHYAIAARIDPNHPGVQFDWALALEAEGKLGEAAEHLLRAVQLDPGFADARDELMRITRSLERQRDSGQPSR